jgi:hypothetical protein
MRFETTGSLAATAIAHDSQTTCCHCTCAAGAKLWAGVEELKELLETALRQGPGVESYRPPACLKP